MNRLMSSVMRGIGRKRRCDDKNDDGNSSGDDPSLDPDFSPDVEESPSSVPVRTTTTANARKPKGPTATKTRRTNTKTRTAARATTYKNGRAPKRGAANDAQLLPGDSADCRRANLDTLPTDVLLRIVEFAASQTGILPLAASLSQVCHRLRHFVIVESPARYASALWRVADFSSLGRQLSTAQLHSLALPRFAAVRCINLEGWPTLRDKDVEAICDKYGDTLCEVSLAGSDHLSGRSLTCLSERCRRITRLSLRRLSHRLAHGQLFNQLVQRHADSLIDLCVDSLQGEIVAFGLLLGGLAASPGALPALRRLRLANLRATSLRDAVLDASALAASAPNLQELELVNLPLADGLAFEGPGCRLPQLRHLLVQELPHPGRLTVSSAALPRLSSLCVIATDFDLVDDLAFNSDEVASVGNGFRGMQRFVMSHCPNADEADTLAPLLQLAESGQLPLLNEADFTSSWIFGSPGGCGRLVAALASLPRLSRLNLTGTGVRLPAVRSIAASAQSLIELNLNSCKSLPRGFKQLLPSRQSIDAWLAKDLPDEEVD